MFRELRFRDIEFSDFSGSMTAWSSMVTGATFDEQKVSMETYRYEKKTSLQGTLWQYNCRNGNGLKGEVMIRTNAALWLVKTGKAEQYAMSSGFVWATTSKYE